MRVEFPLIQTTPVETGKSGDQKVPVHRSTSASVKNSDTDEKSSNVLLGLGGTYSIASLKVAAEHQAKFSTVAENNVLATQSVSRIPDSLLKRFTP
jgi:hypothetical protein